VGVLRPAPQTSPRKRGEVKEAIRKICASPEFDERQWIRAFGERQAASAPSMEASAF
jgi:hypothetical protein